MSLTGIHGVGVGGTTSAGLCLREQVGDISRTIGENTRTEV